MIQILTQPELSDIVKYPDGRGEHKPYGLFLSHENGKWVACDNSEGNAWTEEFDTLEDAIDWLNSDESKEEFEERKRRLSKPAFQDPDEPTALAYTGDKIPEVQRPKKQEPPKPKNPLDAPVTKRDLLSLAWIMFYSGTLTLTAYARFESKMKGDSNA